MSVPESVRILYITNDGAAAEAFKKKLEPYDYHLEISRTSEEGLVNCQSIPYDLLAFDQHLAGFTGLELLRIISSMNLQVPTIMLLDQGDQKASREALALGARDVLLKTPQGLGLLPFVIERVLNHERIVDENLQIKRALQASEDRFRTMIEHSSDLIVVLDQDNRFVYVSPSCTRLGYAPEEIKGKELKDLVHPDDIPKLSASIKTSSQTPLKAVKIPDIRMQRKDGRWRHLEGILTNFLHQPGIEGIVINVKDTTSKKELQAQLLQSHKMKAITSLANGIAHQFNNALVGIMGNVELLKMDFPDDENLEIYFSHIMASMDKMVHLTKQLTAYARGGKFEAKIESFNEFIHRTVPLIQSIHHPSVHLEIDLCAEKTYVMMDITQMQMVLSSVMENAVEALDEGGNVCLVTRIVDLIDRDMRNYPHLNPGRYVRLDVKDDGKGMDKETLNRVFDPFFTTRYHGRGLGMAAAYGIIKNHEGHIAIRSEPERGTRVVIHLPIMEAPVKSEAAIQVDVARGTGTVLFIEDEEIVMDVGAMILTRLGYRVLTAKNAFEGIRIAEQHEGPIDLALLDVGLPDMDGRKLYSLLMKTRPSLPVIVCSGFSVDGVIQEILNAGAQGFIKKPFALAPLSAKIQEVLKRSDPAEGEHPLQADSV